MRIFGDLFGGNERISERSDGINKDLGPFQRDCQFLFFEKQSFCVLINFFNMGTLPPPKVAKTLEGQ